MHKDSTMNQHGIFVAIGTAKLWFLETSDLTFILFGCFEDIHLET